MKDNENMAVPPDPAREADDPPVNQEQLLKEVRRIKARKEQIKKIATTVDRPSNAIDQMYYDVLATFVRKKEGETDNGSS